MTRLRYTSLALLLVPMALFAQQGAPAAAPAPKPPHYRGPAFLSAQDSLDFAQFREHCSPKEDTRHVAIITDNYRLVWHEARHGAYWVVTRGDGRSLIDFMEADPAGMRFPFWLDQQPFSDRCRMVVYDEPTGLINRDVWYFEAP